MLYLYLYIRNLLAREEGQDLIEYALLLGFIALAVTAILLAVSGSLQALWQNVANELANVPPP